MRFDNIKMGERSTGICKGKIVEGDEWKYDNSTLVVHSPLVDSLPCPAYLSGRFAGDLVPNHESNEPCQTVLRNLLYYLSTKSHED